MVVQVDYKERRRVRDLVWSIKDEHIQEGYPVPTVRWTGKTKHEDGDKWYLMEISGEVNEPILHGWVSGRLEDGLLVFEEELLSVE